MQFYNYVSTLDNYLCGDAKFNLLTEIGTGIKAPISKMTYKRKFLDFEQGAKPSTHQPPPPLRPRVGPIWMRINWSFQFLTKTITYTVSSSGL